TSRTATRCARRLPRGSWRPPPPDPPALGDNWAAPRERSDRGVLLVAALVHRHAVRGWVGLVRERGHADRLARDDEHDRLVSGERVLAVGACGEPQGVGTSHGDDLLEV